MSEFSQIYFAGGCFWGLQEFFARMPGVVQSVAGYAQSNTIAPSYDEVCSGKTGAAETVRVVFDPAQTSAVKLAQRFFEVIDPFAVNRQGPDIGPQYRTGIYFSDPAQEPELAQLFDHLQKNSGKFATTLEPLKNFFPAERWHQDYLRSHPGGYCHITLPPLPQNMPAPHRPAAPELAQLSAEEEYIIRQGGTEPPFTGKYWNNHADGLYVDPASGEPLFSSRDKFDSGTGWPSFTRPVSPMLLPSVKILATIWKGSKSGAPWLTLIWGMFFQMGPMVGYVTALTVQDCALCHWKSWKKPDTDHSGHCSTD